jgi:uncharacterized membrane protein YciS (DUF1049 family)
MSFKAILKTIAFLIILFVMLYIGLNNRETIGFSFPVAQIKLNAPAAIIFFGMFSVGVLAGTLLHGGGGGGGGRKSSSKER